MKLPDNSISLFIEISIAYTGLGFQYLNCMMWAFGLVFHLLFLFSKWPIGENGEEEEEENSVEFSEEKYYKFVPRNSILPL